MLSRRSLLAIFGTFDLLVFAFFLFAIMTISKKTPVVRFQKIDREIPKVTAVTELTALPETNRTVHHVGGSNISVSSSVNGNGVIKLTVEAKDYPGCHWKIKECRRRLPRAIIVGVKKCGTGTLRYFLKVHPQIAFSLEEEVHYFNVPSRFEKGIDWYRQQMPFSRPGQVTLEKTPRYFVSSAAPSGIHDQVSPKTKIIILLRDPVKRAVSDYLAMMSTLGLSEPKTDNITDGQIPPYVDPIYDIKPDFEHSVLDDDGAIKEWNGLVNIGIYSNHIQRWLDLFPRDQLLVLDSDTLTKHPVAALKKVEAFLGLASFFEKGQFHYSPKKGFYCLNISGRVQCQGSAKGRKHPTVDSAVLTKLRDFYRPYDDRLAEMLHQNFSWMTSS